MGQLMYKRIKFHNLFTLIFFLSLLLFTAQKSYGASVTLAWDPNSEEDLAGYKIYYGTSPENYGSPIVLGKTTEYELAGLTEGATYYIAITAHDTSDNESENSDEVNGTPPDTQNPTITITSPTSSATYDTSNSTINIGGTASDNVGITSATWSPILVYPLV